MNLDKAVIVKCSVKDLQETENVVLNQNNLDQGNRYSEISSSKIRMLTETSKDIGCLQSDKLSKKKNNK